MTRSDARDEDKCEHGFSMDDDCRTCDAEIAEAKAAGATTPFEIGLYWRGFMAGRCSCRDGRC